MLLMGKSTISMAIFNCYVSSPEGKPPLSYGFPMVFLWFSNKTCIEIPGDGLLAQQLRVGVAVAPLCERGLRQLAAGASRFGWEDTWLVN